MTASTDSGPTALCAHSMDIMAAGSLKDFERVFHPEAVNREASVEPPATRQPGPAGVSVKTVEALYRTKAELLKEVVDYTIAGDLLPIPVLGRDSVAAMEAAPDAPAMVGLHARHTRAISERAAPIFWVVEQAAPAHQDVARLWAQMCDNRRTGARWAATTLLTKPGLPPHLSQDYAEEVFWIAIDTATYRSLTLGRDLSPADFETWIKNFYVKMLLH